MGDRISISFVNGDNKSVALFSHWGGEEFRDEALAYVKALKKEIKGNQGCEPIERLEPETVMVDFIRHITKTMTRVKSDLYLGKDSSDGDNSDNGHFDIQLD